MHEILTTNRLIAASGIAVAGLALTISAASADALVVVSLAGEAFDGPPTFELMIGGKAVGSGTLKKAVKTESDGRLFTKPRPSQFLEEFSFSVPDAGVLSGQEVSIALTNDKYAEVASGSAKMVLDRNLFVNFVSVNGLEVTSPDLALTLAGEVQHLDYQAGLLPIYEAGYRVVARPPADGWPDSAPSAKATPGSSAADIAQPSVPRPVSWKIRVLAKSGQ